MCFSVQVDIDLTKLAEEFKAEENKKAFDYFYSMQNQSPKQFKYITENDSRIFAKTWAPLLVNVRNKFEIRPMRYQLLPHFCEEDKYTRVDFKSGKKREINSTYNARLDSLQSAKAWQKPFMNYHGVIPLKSFYEWVEFEGKKRQINIFSKTDDTLYVPCLYDNWYSKDKSEIIQSFAIITTDPTEDILEMGHDRRPITIEKSMVEKWLTPKENLSEILSILENPYTPAFDHNFVDQA